MIITSWTSERLSQDGADTRVEWCDNERHLTVYEDDCEVMTLALGLGCTAAKADVAARTLVKRIESIGTAKLQALLDESIDRAFESKLDAVYAEPVTHCRDCDPDKGHNAR